MGNPYVENANAEIVIKKESEKIIVSDDILDIDFYKIECRNNVYSFFKDASCYIKKILFKGRGYNFKQANTQESYLIKNFDEISDLIGDVKPVFKFNSKIISYLVKRHGYGITHFEFINHNMWEGGNINVLAMANNKNHLNDLVKFLMLHKYMLESEDYLNYYDKLMSLVPEKYSLYNSLLAPEIKKLDSDPNVILNIENKYKSLKPEIRKLIRIILTANYFLNIGLEKFFK